MIVEQLLALPRDGLRAALRGRAHGMQYAPRRPFEVGVAVGDDVAEPFAIVLGPRVRRAYRWRDLLGDRARSGRLAIDGRAFADAAFADATAGAWLLPRVPSPEDERAVRLAPGFIIGRGSEAHLRIEASTIARQHCRFDVVDGQWVVEDLRSTNGTWLGNTRVDRAVLANHDVLNIGGRGVAFRDTLAMRPRAVDAADDVAWGRLFLDRIELDLLSHEVRYERATAVVEPRRAGTAVWSLAGVAARDTRWLMRGDDDASVLFDALVAAEGDERDAPLVGDDCAVFARGAIVVRVGAVVGRLDWLGEPQRVDRADNFAERIVDHASW
nr:FHA domain-containing protein [Kofleriaceae bacterium]